jgi:hypothetical protein
MPVPGGAQPEQCAGFEDTLAEISQPAERGRDFRADLRPDSA